MSGLRDWIGRRREASDRVDPERVRAMQALLDRDEALAAGDPLPPLWHWVSFWETAPQSGLGRDGHAARGEFLPPVALPRRMWAGSRLRFLRPLPIGATIRRISTIEAVEEKQGRSGPLVFVTVGHRLEHEGETAVEEQHDIVYREAPSEPASLDAAAKTSAAEPAPGVCDWAREIRPDPVLLFRYSALTFNGHRIHYDRDYCREVEGYPGLIVHGPLLATLMVDLVRRERPDREIGSFSFRAKRPVFDTAPFTVAGQAGPNGAAVWIAGPDGELAMDGRVGFAKAGTG